MNIAVVVSDFHEEVTSRMLLVAEEKAAELKLDVTHVCRVPGAYDMPVLVDSLLRRADVDAVVTLGAVIRGQTRHDEVIAHAAALALTDLSIKHGKPVSLGVSGPGMHARHAHARIRPVAERAVLAAVKIYDELGKVRK